VNSDMCERVQFKCGRHENASAIGVDGMEFGEGCSPPEKTRVL